MGSLLIQSAWTPPAFGRQQPAGVLRCLCICLLACSRYWNQSEATSIWVEIVAKRRAEIVIACENNELAHLAALSAARQELTRSQLANWDASARAWLQTADEAYKFQDHQLTLVINNVDLPVDQNLDP